MLLGTLGARLLGNILAGREINRDGDGVIRASYGSKKNLILPHPLTNFEIQIQFILEIIGLIK